MGVEGARLGSVGLAIWKISSPEARSQTQNRKSPQVCNLKGAQINTTTNPLKTKTHRSVRRILVMVSSSICSGSSDVAGVLGSMGLGFKV